MNTKNNRRAQETRQRIQSALLNLLEQQELEQITVCKLCQQAEVNRSTFYAHYDSVMALMEEIEQSIGQDTIEALRPHFASSQALMSRDYLRVILQQIHQNQPFYRAYLKSTHGMQQVHWGFAQLLDGVMRPYMHDLGVLNDNEVEYYFTFFREGMLAVVRRWVDDGCVETPDRITEIIGNMVNHPELNP